MTCRSIKTLADLSAFIQTLDLPAHRRRDLLSAIAAVCRMLGRSPREVPTNSLELRFLLQTIRPAAQDLKPKTFSNLRSLIASALKHAGQIDDLPRGLAKRHEAWHKLMIALLRIDRPAACALAKFANWCAFRGIRPEYVNDETLFEFLGWLETRTLHPTPKVLVRRVPLAWRIAQEKMENWPKSQLRRISFKAPQLRISWGDLPERFRHEADRYLSSRKNLDPFDEDDDAPTGVLADSTIRQIREHLRISASILIRQHGVNPDTLALGDLVKPEPFKSILRSLRDKAADKHRQAIASDQGKTNEPIQVVPANAFVIGLAMTLLSLARNYVKVQPEELVLLRKYKSKLGRVPFDLTNKNKHLLRQLKVPATQAKLVFLPEFLQQRVADELKLGRVRFVDAQVALAIDLQLVLPLRPQNLHSLHSQRHFIDMGAKGLRLFIPAEETKSKIRDIVADVPFEVAQRIAWYRKTFLPQLRASESGHLFVRHGGARKDQKTLAGQIIKAINTHVGVHMTPHQFRHFAAVLYLEQHPNDFETVRNLLGHAVTKSTLVYAGSSTERSGRAYATFLFERRDELRMTLAKRRRRSNSVLPLTGA